MSFMDLKSQLRQWRKDDFLISTDPNLIPISSVNEAFASDEVYWAKPLPDDVMRATLENSLCFGLYQIFDTATDTTITTSPPASADSLESGWTSYQEKLHFIGLGRCITDFTTFLYLTDVYVKPEYQGKGLGKWLVSCIQEVIESMPHLRRSLIFTGDWKRSVPFYEKLMDMDLIESRRTEDGTDGVGLAVLMRKGSGHP